MPIEFSLRTYLRREIEAHRDRTQDDQAQLPICLNGRPVLLSEIHTDFLLAYPDVAGRPLGGRVMVPLAAVDEIKLR